MRNSWVVARLCLTCDAQLPAERTGRVTTPPEGLQLDLLTAVARMRQIRDEPDSSELILYRLLTCDLRRLESYLTPETLAWSDGVAHR